VHTTEIHGKRLVDGVIVDAIEYVHWNKTEEKNGVRVSWEVKKHNKILYIQAVKDQLLYFKDNLEFIEVYDGVDTSLDQSNMFATILYESKSFIISNNSRFTKPHILINNVNYGNIDFSELGINVKYGNIAIKAGSSDIDITASREAVKWTEKTRDYVLKAIEEASYEAGKVLEEVLINYKNPIERYIQANSSTLNFSQSKNSEVIKQLKAFCGEVKLSIPISTIGYIDEEIRKKAEIPDTLEISKIMMYIDTLTVIHNISVNQARINASKAINLFSIIMDKKNLFLISDKNVKGLNTSIAHFWSKGKLDFQYIIFKNIDAEMISKEEALKAKIPYKSIVKNYYQKQICRGIFIKLINKYITDVNSLDQDEIKSYVSLLKITEDQVITVKSDTEYSYTVQHKTEKDRKDELLKQLKKSKLVLPYKRLSITVQLSFKMETIKQEDILEIKSKILYATTKEKELLLVAGFILEERNLLGISLNEENKYTCILISEENVKLFNQIPNSMSIQSFFKEDHQIIDGVLHIKSGRHVIDFMTNIRLLQAMRNFPAFFIFSKKENRVYHIFNNELSVRVADSDMVIAEEIRQRLKTMPLHFNSTTSEEIIDKAKETFKSQLDVKEEFIHSLISTLENMTILQDTPNSEYIESEELKTIVSPFNGYKVEFYNKQFVDQSIAFMRKYELLLLYCVEKDAINSTYNSNNASTAAILNKLSNQITEFFNNLNE
jgi:hypothetical protein